MAQNEQHQEPKIQCDDDVCESDNEVLVESFDDMGLNEDVLRGIYGYGFEKPSEIQKRAIPPLIQSYALCSSIWLHRPICHHMSDM